MAYQVLSEGDFLLPYFIYISSNLFGMWYYSNGIFRCDGTTHARVGDTLLYLHVGMWYYSNGIFRCDGTTHASVGDTLLYLHV